MCPSEDDCSSVFELIANVVNSQSEGIDILRSVTEVLYRNVDHYDWVGFYLANRSDRTLSLGPFTGESTEHTEIGYGEGICGQSASTEQSYIVQNVAAEENYLACSPKVQSEIVVPIFCDGHFVGELDIDSHEKNAFTEGDKHFLQRVAKLIAHLL